MHMCRYVYMLVRACMQTCLLYMYTYTTLYTCVRLQELFSCGTEVGHQQMSPDLEWRGLLGPQLGPSSSSS